MTNKYIIKEEFLKDKENSKTLEELLEEVFIEYLVEKIDKGS